MATAPSNRRVGTGFINLADWSRANAGAANSLAGRLAGDVDAQGNAVANDMRRLQGAYDDASDLATINYEDPRGDAARAEYLSRNTYAGPNSLSDVGDFDATLGRADAAESAARRANDYYGRQGALQSLYGQTGAYTPGQQRLDSALAGVAGKERFGALQQRWGNLYNQTQAQDTSARQDAARRTATTADAAARYGAEGARLRAEQRARETAAEQEAAGRELPLLEEERRNRINERRGTCPAPWTPILMAGGEARLAGTLKVGDVVRTQHEETLEWGDYPIVDVSTHEAERWAVTLEDGRELTASFNHRVHTEAGDWVEVARLMEGTHLSGGVPGIVASVKRLGVGTVVLLTVEDAHTYQTVGLLSHNAKRSNPERAYLADWG